MGRRKRKNDDVEIYDFFFGEEKIILHLICFFSLNERSFNNNNKDNRVEIIYIIVEFISIYTKSN